MAVQWAALKVVGMVEPLAEIMVAWRVERWADWMAAKLDA